MLQGAPPAASPATCFGFSFAGSRLAVTCDDPWAARLLRRAFPLLRCTPADAEETASILRCGDGLRARFGGRDVVFSLAEYGAFGAAHAAVREIFARFAHDAGHGAAFYGAAVSVGGYGCALLGSSGIGKSVLALEIARTGGRLLGDETLILDSARGRVRALPRYPALREPALRHLANPLRDAVSRCPYSTALLRGRFWYALPPHYLNGIAPDASAHALRSIVIVRGRAERAHLQRVTTGTLVEYAFRSLYFKPHSLSAVAQLRSALSHVEGFEMWLGAPGETASLLMERLACA